MSKDKSNSTTISENLVQAKEISQSSKVTVNNESLVQAKNILEQAYSQVTSNEYKPSSSISKCISYILSENHLTYKYVLVNALLAKSTLPNINILCLQQKSELPGAYDARSICHKVLVPFERDYLNGALGRSNEPFLNKPARYPELSLSNAVRKGHDANLLKLLCNTLPTIQTSAQSFLALKDCIFYLLEISKEKSEIYSISRSSITSLSNIENFYNELLTESFGGETLVLAVGSILTLHSSLLANETRVEIHVVNQSGASSKEVGDIDVYSDNKLLYSIEAKDKIYSEQDVEHAVRKVAESGFNRMLFITGPRAKFTGESYTVLVQKASNLGVYLTFTSGIAFIKHFLSYIPTYSLNNIIDILLDIHKTARLKDETLTWLLELARKHQLIN